MPLTSPYSKNMGKKNYFNRFDPDEDDKPRELNETLEQFPYANNDKFLNA